MELDDEQVNLAEAALAIAATEYPDLDPHPWLALLDRIAARVETGPPSSALENIAALNRVLFEQEKLCGNEEEYDDPRNSYLNDVLDRKKGIPITLSVIYIEVARRRGLPLVGVGFPGHFIVKYLEQPSEILIDPYHGGALLTSTECAELLRAHFGAQAELKHEYFAAATPKQILARMLNNLKGSYFRRANYAKVLTMIEMALAIGENPLASLRDRGMIYFAMRRYREAQADLKTYLKLTSNTDPETQKVLQTLRRVQALMN